MINIISKIIVDILTAIYQSFGFSIILAILAMFFYLFATDKELAGQGFKKSACIWLEQFRSSQKFRKLFFLLLYTAMILFKTLLNRDLFMNPLANVMGEWWIYEVNTSTGEVRFSLRFIENIIMFIPFSMLLMWFKELREEAKRIVLESTRTAFVFSVAIEFVQLFFRMGTFQLSDLFYNTLGGFLGGAFYYLLCRIKSHIDEKNVRQD